MDLGKGTQGLLVLCLLKPIWGSLLLWINQRAIRGRYSDWSGVNHPYLWLGVKDVPGGPFSPCKSIVSRETVKCETSGHARTSSMPRHQHSVWNPVAFPPLPCGCCLGRVLTSASEWFRSSKMMFFCCLPWVTRNLMKEGYLFRDCQLSEKRTDWHSCWKTKCHHWC